MNKIIILLLTLVTGATYARHKSLSLEIDYTNPTSINSGTPGTSGLWGTVEHCPRGSAVVGFNIRYVPYRGSAGSVGQIFGAIFSLGITTAIYKGENAFDDYGVIGIRLDCNDLENNKRVKQIHSDWFTDDDIRKMNNFDSVGQRWLDDEIFCPRLDPAIGFQLKAEPSQGSGDNFGVVNFKLVCPGAGGNLADPHIVFETVQDVDWSGVSKCPEGSVVCGIQTKMHRVHKKIDSAGLTDVRLDCCPVQVKSSNLDCTAEKRDKKVSHVRNCYKDQSLHQEIRLLKSSQNTKSQTDTKGRTDHSHVSTTFGVETETGVNVKGLETTLKTKFEQEFGQSWVKRHETQLTNIDLLQEESEEIIKVTIPARHVGFVDQLLFICGKNIVRTKMLSVYSRPVEEGDCPS